MDPVPPPFAPPPSSPPAAPGAAPSPAEPAFAPAPEPAFASPQPAFAPYVEPAPPPPPPPRPRLTAEPRTVADALRVAREGQPAWAALPLSARIRAIAKLKDRLLARADEIAATVAEETGKPIEEALLAEVIPNADLVEYWTGAAHALLDPEELYLDVIAYPGKAGLVHREPRGVVALITPWNFPVAIPLRTLVPALLAGNAVIFKPSEVTPRSGALVASLFEGLLPLGALTLVQGAGDVGASLVSGDVDLVVFTGSVRTGKRIAVACAERLVPCSLELGGKDAAIVLADANLERAAQGVVWGAFTNAGQNCASIERVFVESAVAAPFLARVAELTAALRPGVDVGPLTTDAQLAIVEAHVRDAVARGADVLAGGLPPSDAPPRFFPPTVLRVTDDTIALMRDETFGPVLPIMVVASADEAIERANASRYGLTASLWTRHVGRAETMARRLRAGVVTINNHAFTGAVPSAPWSGVGETGHGITNSPHALAELTRPCFVLVDESRAKRELWWYPYTPALRVIARSMATLRGGAGLFAKIGALFRLLGAFPKRLRGG